MTFLYQRFLLGLFLFALMLSTQAQVNNSDNPLTRLLAERKILTNRYNAASAQRHSLFGNKPSKKDLQEVVDALQGIVDKDEQIVAFLNHTTQSAQTAAQHYSTAASQLQNTSRDDRNLTVQRLAELQNDLANAQERERKYAEHQREIEADLSEAKQGRFVRDGLIGGLGLVCLGLLLLRNHRSKRIGRLRK